MNAFNEAFELSEGHVAAIGAMAALQSSGFASTILKLKEFDIRGSDIWALYSEICSAKPSVMAHLLTHCSPDRLKAAIKRERNGRDYLSIEIEEALRNPLEPSS